MIRCAARLAAALSLLLLLLCACTPSSERDSKQPNVVLVLIDTLRADHLPAYGYPLDTAPFLSRLAAEGALFEAMYATAPATAPATASIFTSLHPFQHGVVNGFLVTRKMQRLDPSVTLNRIADELETLPEVMRRAGYRTFGVADNLNIGEEMGFSTGFDRFRTLRYRGAKAVNESVLAWRDELAQRQPFFLYVHYIDPHDPYRPHPEWYEAFGGDGAPTAAYDSEIRYTDHHFQNLYESLGLGSETLVIVSSDHGEAFGEHGHWRHGQDVHQPEIAVPLLVHHPGGGVVPQRVVAPASGIDLLPTLRAAAGLEASSQDRGRNWWPLLLGSEAAETPRPRSLLAELTRKDRGVPAFRRRALVSQNWKYVRQEPLAPGYPAQERLFELGRDPGESNDRLANHPELGERLRAELDRLLEDAQLVQGETRRLELDEATLEHLETLGYVD